MTNVTLNNAVKNLDSLIEQTLDNDDIINVATDGGNVIIISEENYRALLLTAEVNANPAFKESLLQGLNAPLSDFVSENEVDW